MPHELLGLLYAPEYQLLKAVELSNDKSLRLQDEIDVETAPMWNFVPPPQTTTTSLPHLITRASIW